jgi:hypothetical protein
MRMGDIVAGGADIAVEEQLPAVLADMGLHALEQPARRPDMSADGTDVRLQ